MSCSLQAQGPCSGITGIPWVWAAVLWGYLGGEWEVPIQEEKHCHWATREHKSLVMGWLSDLGFQQEKCTLALLIFKITDGVLAFKKNSFSLDFSILLHCSTEDISLVSLWKMASEPHESFMAVYYCLIHLSKWQWDFQLLFRTLSLLAAVRGKAYTKYYNVWS